MPGKQKRISQITQSEAAATPQEAALLQAPNKSDLLSIKL
jgi:hypothetical protein